LAKQIKEMKKILKTQGKDKKFKQTRIYVLRSLPTVAESYSARQVYANAVSSTVVTCKLKTFKL
jgi:hypothetical protein